MHVYNKGQSRHLIPSQILLCPFLEKLELHWCKIVWFPTPTFVHHSNLKSLTLHKSCFTSYQFRCMISCCKLLESLKVDCCVEVKRLVITGASKLSSLEITTRRRLHIVLEGTNQLRRFSLECLRYWNEYGYNDRPKKFLKFCVDLSHDSNEKISLKFCEMFAEVSVLIFQTFFSYLRKQQVYLRFNLLGHELFVLNVIFWEFADVQFWLIYSYRITKFNQISSHKPCMLAIMISYGQYSWLKMVAWLTSS